MALVSEKQDSFRKRKRHKFSLHKNVEVKSEEEGLLGSWHPGIINACNQRGWIVIYDVRYDHMLADDGSNLIVQIRVSFRGEDTYTVSEKQRKYRGRIRPAPPSIVFGKWDLPYGICVDVYYQECWWEGVIFDHEDGSNQRKVFFPDLGDEMITDLDMVRISQDWNEVSNTWHRRGTWMFLELIAEYEEENFLPVSVKQLWYDLKEKGGFQKLGEWSSPRKALLRQLVLQIIGNNFQLVIGNLFDMAGCCDEAEQQLKFAKPVHENHMNPGTDLVVYNDVADTAVCSLPKDLFSVSSNLDGIHIAGAAINVDQNLASNSENNDKKQSSLPHRVVWLPAGPDIVSGAESCPEAVFEYVQKHTNRDRNLVLQDVKKHLLHLKWTIDFMRDKDRIRLRCTSPQGKHYYSLLEICNYLISNNVNNVSSNTHDKKSSLLSSVSDSFSPHIETSEGNKESNSVSPADFDASDSDILVFKSKSYNQADVDWYKSGLQRRFHKDMKAKARELSQSKKCTMKSSLHLGRYANLHKMNARGIKKFQSKGKDALCIVPHFIRIKDIVTAQNSRLSNVRYKNCRGFIKLKNQKRNRQQKRMLQSGKKAREIKTTDPSRHIPRTLLCWLIENNVVLPRAKVCYCTKEDLKPFKEGRIIRGGIKCACCQDLFTLGEFEAHAGSKTRCPSANIFLKDGRSLLNCQMQIIRDKKNNFMTRQPDRLKGGRYQNQNDYVCSVCRYGGELILCDRCPSSFHKKCLGMKDIPSGDWFCPSCRCRICDQNKLRKNDEHCLDDSVQSCSQCERKYHFGCIRKRREGKLEDNPEEDWFCSRKCESIFMGLHELLGKPIPVGDNLTWTLLKPVHPDNEASDIEVFAENHSKLHIALDVMHECFDPVEEPQTRRDIVRDVIFSQGSDLNRLNFRGFYTILLEKNDEIITVASVRVYGEELAEIPLVGTRFQYRRLGMCRILMNVLEEKLINLGVQRLILPAAPGVLNTWTDSFGFSKISDAERLKFLDYTFLEFQGTIMCHKPLMEIPCVALSSSKEILLVNSDDVGKSCDFSGLCDSDTDALQEDQVEESRIMEVEQASDSYASNDGAGIEGIDIPANKTSEFDCEPCIGEISAPKQCSFREDGTLKCYKRRKASRGEMKSFGWIKDLQGCIS